MNQQPMRRKKGFWMLKPDKFSQHRSSTLKKSERLQQPLMTSSHPSKNTTHKFGCFMMARITNHQTKWPAAGLVYSITGADKFSWTDSAYFLLLLL